MGVDHKHLKGKAARFYRESGMKASYRRREAEIRRRMPKERNEPAYLGMDSCEGYVLPGGAKKHLRDPPHRHTQ